jgi:hypothetical protein
MGTLSAIQYQRGESGEQQPTLQLRTLYRNAVGVANEMLAVETQKRIRHAAPGARTLQHNSRWQLARVALHTNEQKSKSP